MNEGALWDHSRHWLNIRPVYAFGEMTETLCRDGLAEAAIAWEDAWNDLAGEHTLFLLCGYDAVKVAAGLTTADEVVKVAPLG